MRRGSISSIRRHELEKAAYEIIYGSDLRKLTLAKLAKHARVSKSILQHYFTNKEELIGAAARYANRLYGKLASSFIKRAESPSARVWAVVNAQLESTLYISEYLKAYLPVLEAGFTNDHIAHIYTIQRARTQSNLLFACRKLLDDAAAKTVVHILANLLEGAWLLPLYDRVATRSRILLLIREYLKNAIPSFDISVTFVDCHRNTKDALPKPDRVPTSTIRRMELEKAALEILYESGFRELTIQRVAERARLSKGVVHHYFLSKDDLVAGALRHEFREFGTAVAQLLRKASTPSERLWIVITTQLADQYLQFSYLRWYLNSLEAGFRSKGISQVYDIAERRGRSNIAAALKGLMPVAAARRMTLTLWSMIEGACYVMFSDRSISRNDVVLGIAAYLISNIPAFDSSVVMIEGTHAHGKRAGVVKSIELEKIHRATHEVIEHVGCRKFTFELLAAHMGILPEAIQQHYRGSYELITATARHVVSKIEQIGKQRSKQAKSASEALWALVYSDIEPAIMTRRVTEVYLSFLEAGMSEPQILEIYEYEEGVRRSTIASELKRLVDLDAGDVVLVNLTTMMQGAWRLLPCDPQMTQSAMLEAMSEYLTRSVPGFDPSVLQLSAQWRAETGAPADQ